MSTQLQHINWETIDWSQYEGMSVIAIVERITGERDVSLASEVMNHYRQWNEKQKQKQKKEIRQKLWNLSTNGTMKPKRKVWDDTELEMMLESHLETQEAERRETRNSKDGSRIVDFLFP